MPNKLKIVHLPVYYDNAYQKLLMDELRKLGHEVIDGGGGGNFLRTCLFKWKPDIFHLHWTHPYMIKYNLVGTIFRACRFILELKIIKITGTKLVWTVHNLTSHDSKYPKLEIFFLKILSLIVDKTIVHGKAAKQIVIKKLEIKHPEKISVIPHGNYIGYYPDNVSNEQSRIELRIKQDSFVLLFFGQIHPYKGVSELISTFKKLNNQNLILIIAGVIPSQRLHEEVNNMISGDTRIFVYPGYIEDNKFQYFLHAADLVVLPYRDILSSGSLILAMGFGCCCLVPDLDVLVEMIGIDSGYIYRKNDQENLQATLNKILNNTSEIHDKGTIARKKVEYWSFKTVAKKTESIYFSIF